MRRFAGILIGLVVGFVAIALLQMVSSKIFPAPAGIDFEDTEQLRSWIQGLPITALILVLVTHALGAFLAAAVCQLIVGDRWVVGWMISGFVVLLAGITNLMAIPHPMWFAVADVAAYLPAAWMGGAMIAWWKTPALVAT